MRANIYFLIFEVSAFLLTNVAPASAECLLHVDIPENNPAAYVDRGNRCEGIYIRPAHASTAPILRGFHVGQPQYNLTADHLSVQVVGYSSDIKQGVF